MKKFIALFIILAFTVVVAACKDKEKTTEQTTTTATQTTTTTAQQTTTTTEETTTTEYVDPNLQTPDAGDKIVEVVTWGFGTPQDFNLLRRRVYAFNEKDNGIFIKMVVPEGNYNEFLQTKAAANELPDVMQLNSVPDAILAGWLADITDIVATDDEWEDIPQALTDSITYDGHVYAVPAGYNFIGYYANLDLIELSGTDAVFNTFDYTYEEFEDAIKDMKNTSKTDGTSTIGLMNANEFVSWLPSLLDPTEKIGHFVWNGNGFDFMGDPINNALYKAAKLYEMKYTFNSFSDKATGDGTGPSDRVTLFGDNWDGAVFRKGQMGFLWDGTWAANGLANDIGDKFEFDFVGVPGNRTVANSDYYAISDAAEDKVAAYTVAKYLTFGSEGINDAFDIIDAAKAEENKNFSMSGLPLNTTEAIVNEWFKAVRVPGIKVAYDKVTAGELKVLMEGNKYVPGFQKARFSHDTGIAASISRPDSPVGKTLTIGDLIWDAQSGLIQFGDYMDQRLADNLNAYFTKAKEELEEILNEQ